MFQNENGEKIKANDSKFLVQLMVMRLNLSIWKEKGNCRNLHQENKSKLKIGISENLVKK